MKTERSGLLAWTLTGLLVFLWLRFLVHTDPRFPGTATGSAFGVAGAILMLVPLLYSVAKRLFRLRGPLLRSFLTVHIYAGLLGGILAIVHTGHKFDHPLGILLTAQTLIVVLSGFIGRYLLQHESRQLSEKRHELATGSAALTQARTELVTRTGSDDLTNIVRRAAIAPIAIRDPDIRYAARQVVRLVDGIASLESSIALHEHFQRWFRRWLRIHIVLTFMLYLFLATHVLAVAYYGLRWWP